MDARRAAKAGAVVKLCNAFTIGYPRHARRARWVRYDNPDPLYLCGECARKLSGWTRQIWDNRLGEPAPEGLRIRRIIP